MLQVKRFAEVRPRESVGSPGPATSPSSRVRGGSSVRGRRKPDWPAVVQRCRVPDRPTAVQGVFGARACAVEGAAECASPPFANSLAGRRIANRRRTSRARKHRRQSGDLRVGSLRAHVKPPLARTRLRHFGQNSLRSGASEPPLASPPGGRGFRAPAIPARLCFTQRANPAHTNLQTRVRAFRVQLRAATRERETNHQKKAQETTSLLYTSPSPRD